MKKEFKIVKTGRMYAVYRRYFFFRWEYKFSANSVEECERSIDRILTEERLTREKILLEKAEKKAKLLAEREAGRDKIVKFYPET